MSRLRCAFIAVIAFTCLLAPMTACRSRTVAASGLSATSEGEHWPWLVRVSSTFSSAEGAPDRVTMTGHGFLVKHDGPDGVERAFVVTSSHLSQGGVAAGVANEDESLATLSIEAFVGGRAVPLRTINRLATLRRDIEIIEVENDAALPALAKLRPAHTSPHPMIAAGHPHGWLEVEDEVLRRSDASSLLSSERLFPLGLKSFIAQSAHVRPIVRSALFGANAAHLESAASSADDPFRAQVFRDGFDLTDDQIFVYRKLPPGFSGAPLVYRHGEFVAVLGLVTTLSRAFDKSWIVPSGLIARTIQLYVGNRLSRFRSALGVRLNDESWVLRHGLLFRTGTFGSELGGAAYAEVSSATSPLGNGSSSGGGNGSSSGGGNGSSSGGGNGSSSGGGNGSSSGGGNGSSSGGGNGSSSGGGNGSSSASDPFETYRIRSGVMFRAPEIAAGAVQRALAFELRIGSGSRTWEYLVEPDMAALNFILNARDPRLRGTSEGDVVAVPVTTRAAWVTSTQAHLRRVGFLEAAGGTFEKRLRLLSLSPQAEAGSAGSIDLTARVAFESENQGATIFLQWGSESVTVRLENDEMGTRPFYHRQSASGTPVIVAAAGLINWDASLASLKEAELYARRPDFGDAMRRLTTKTKALMRIGDEDYLLLDRIR